MLAFDDVKEFWEYVIFYPYEDESNYDGVHDGGIKGISENAPDSAKQAFLKYQEMEKEAERNGVKL